MELQDYSASYFIEDVKQRFYPRNLILNDDSLYNCLYKTLDILEQNTWKTRMYQLSKASDGNYLDLTQVQIPGVGVKKVTKVYSLYQIQSMFTVYQQILGETPLYFNILRNQDMFMDFLLLKTVQSQLTNRFKNKEVDWMQVGNKLMLGPFWATDTTVTISFYPIFIKENNNYELYSIENNFVKNYLEGLIMYREGRAMSELEFTDLKTNASEYMTDGKELMESVLKEFAGGGILKLGKRW